MMALEENYYNATHKIYIFMSDAKKSNKQHNIKYYYRLKKKKEY